MSGDAVSEPQVAVDLVVGLPREDLTNRRARGAGNLTEVPVEQVERVGCIVVERSTTLGLLAAPGRTLRPEDDRTVRLGQDVGDLAQQVGVKDCLDLPESRDVPVVIPDLAHESLARETVPLVRESQLHPW